MDRDTKVRLIQEHYDTFWQGNLDDVDRQLSPEFVDASAPEGSPPGPAGPKAAAEIGRAAFPDMRVTVEDAVIAGNTVAVLARWNGTHTGSMMGIEATGKTVEVSGIVVWKLNDEGAIVHRCEHVDMSEFMRQIQA